MDKKQEKILSDAHQVGGLSTAGFKHIAKAVRKSENRRGDYPKAGRVFVFASRRFLGARSAAAPYLQASPKVNGVRMRYQTGKLVPR